MKEWSIINWAESGLVSQSGDGHLGQWQVASGLGVVVFVVSIDESAEDLSVSWWLVVGGWWVGWGTVGGLVVSNCWFSAGTAGGSAVGGPLLVVL